MYDPEMRKDCPMRGNLGNCSPVGGFCMDAVSDEICEAVHNAYYHGYKDAVIIMLKKQEPKKAIYNEEKYKDHSPHCPKWEKVLPIYSTYGEANFCHRCGQAVKWNE